MRHSRRVSGGHIPRLGRGCCRTAAGEQESPPREEGWPRPQEIIAKHPHLERTGWSLTEALSCERPPRLRELRCLREIFLVAQPPLLTVWPGYIGNRCSQTWVTP